MRCLPPSQPLQVQLGKFHGGDGFAPQQCSKLRDLHMHRTSDFGTVSDAGRGHQYDAYDIYMHNEVSMASGRTVRKARASLEGRFN